MVCVGVGVRFAAQCANDSNGGMAPRLQLPVAPSTFVTPGASLHAVSERYADMADDLRSAVAARCAAFASSVRTVRCTPA